LQKYLQSSACRQTALYCAGAKVPQLLLGAGYSAGCAPPPRRPDEGHVRARGVLRVPLRFPLRYLHHVLCGFALIQRQVRNSSVTAAHVSNREVIASATLTVSHWALFVRPEFMQGPALLEVIWPRHRYQRKRCQRDRACCACPTDEDMGSFAPESRTKPRG